MKDWELQPDLNEMANFYFPKPQRQPKHKEIKIVEDINLINQGIEGKHPALESSEFFFLVLKR